MKVNKIIKLLKKEYPDPKCMLFYNAPHELLIAARLSAQCTDKRVNTVTPALFAEYTDIKAFANADVSDIERIVKSCGLYKTKAADIVNMCKILQEKHNCIVPDNMPELLELPGVGRKTANLILGELYNKPAIVTDTHVIRLSNRLGLINPKSTNPLIVERVLVKSIPAEESLMFCHRLVLHGRSTCKARNPDCEKCILKNTCNYQ
ncbi:MAG: endonuclease III [Oscillospiraceae bacterium]|nr:endonuclease III [Oscillospiraceae bacterium]